MLLYPVFKVINFVRITMNLNCIHAITGVLSQGKDVSVNIMLIEHLVKFFVFHNDT